MIFVNVDWFFLSHRKNVARYLLDRGHEISVYTEFTKRSSKQDRKNFSMVNSPISRSNFSFVSLLIEVVRSYILLKREKPDIVHAVTVKPILIMGMLSRILNIPFIASISGFGPAFAQDSVGQKLRARVLIYIYKFIFKRSNARIICQSESDKAKVSGLGIMDIDLIDCIKSSGVDRLKFYPEQESNGVVHVLMASRLLRQKGIYEYIEAARLVNNSAEYDVNFSLAGGLDRSAVGSLSEADLIELKKHPHINFLGEVSDMSGLLNKTDIFVLPSYYPEGIPKVLIEAAASGCAIITTDHGGCREAILPGRSGLLVPVKDCTELSKAMVTLLEDPILIRKMGNYSRIFSRDHATELINEQHLFIYNSILGQIS